MENSRSRLSPMLLVDKQPFLEDDCACPDSSRLFVANQEPVLENDCACPTTSSMVRQQRDENRLYGQIENVFVDSLPQGFRLAFSPYAPQGPSALNTPAWERWQSFNQPQQLTHPVDYLLAEQNLILPVGEASHPLPSHPESLTVWLHVTNACNLDCPYCYVQKSPASMSEAVGREAIDKIFQTAQTHQFKSVKLKYAGGEATLQFGRIKKLSTLARSLSKESGINLSEVVLSNGTHIRPEDAAWLIENNMRLMISLDGVGKIHDQMRPYRNGKGSFQAISQTIDRVLLPRGIIPMLTITITQQNAAGTAEAVRWALERDLPVSLNFYRHNPDSLLDLAAEENVLIDGMLAAYKVYEEILPSRPFLNGLLDRVQASGHRYTCGVGSSYLVINHNGALAQCQMLLDKPVSPILMEDLLAQVQNGPLHNLAVEQKETCHTCVFRYRCAGGCPLETYQVSSRWDAPSPNCHIYKTLLPFALRLEGLRLLKNHGYLN